MNKSGDHYFQPMNKLSLYFSVKPSLFFIIYENDTFELPVTQSDLAALIATTRESVRRTFTKFRNEGIIELNGKTITILKVDLLEKISKTG